MRSPHNQSGVALIVALLMLAVLALLGVSAVNNSTVNLRVTYNVQSYLDSEATSQDLIEQIIGDIANFKNPQYGNYYPYPGMEVTSEEPVCLGKAIAEGYSAKFPLAPLDTEWEIRSVATDTITGAEATLTQGVAITMTAGYCP